MTHPRTVLWIALVVLLGSAVGASAWQLDPGLAQEYPILVQAIEQAKRDVQSEEGVECFLSPDGDPLDQGQDPNEFDDDDEGPSVDVEDLNGAYGVYRRGTAPDTVTVDLDLVLDAQSGDCQAFEVLVATIVHETAHWVDHKVDGGRDTPGEEGCAMEVWIYGWSKQIWNVDGIKPQAVDATDAVSGVPTFQRHRLPWPFCRTAPSSSLSAKVQLDRNTYSVGDSVGATLTLTNISNATISLVDRFDIEGAYATFTILDPSWTRVEYDGPEIAPRIEMTDFIGLAPGASITRKLLVNADAGGYPLTKVGTYTLDVTYHQPPFSCPLFATNLYEGSVVSNRVTFNIMP